MTRLRDWACIALIICSPLLIWGAAALISGGPL